MPLLNDNIKKLVEPLKSFKDILWFLTLFVCFEFLWKLCVHIGEGEEERFLLVLGNDLTSYTDGLCQWTADTVHWVMHSLLGYHDLQKTGIMLYFEGSLPLDIIWSCTGLKQFIMFSFIMAFYYGPARKKLWFIPLSLFILAVVNILRLVIILIIIREPFPEWFIGTNEWYNGRTWENTQVTYWQFYKDWFNVFHKDVFTWLYYDGIIFVLWLVWEEKINKPYKKFIKNPKN